MDLASQQLGLERDDFVRDLLRELSGLMEEIVGLDEARGFIALVGQRIGRRIDALYTPHLGDGEWPVSRLAEVLVDLKRRIQGGFRIESVDALRIVLVNDACPFGEYVHGRPSLCMMTANVFGTVAANHRGFAQVAVLESIAKGDGRCRVIVDLDSTHALADAKLFHRA